MATSCPPDRMKPCLHQPLKDSPPTGLEAEVPEGGHTEEFVELVDDKYKCEECHRVLRNAMQTACGHRFCDSCIGGLLRNPGHVCPVDEELLHSSKVFFDNCCRKEVMGLWVYCRNHKAGCQVQILLSALEGHLKTCSFQRVPCSRPGCSELLLQQDLRDHLNLNCRQREVKCQYCQIETTVAELKKHETSECRTSLISCPKYCGKQLHRAELTEHMVECPKAERCCSFTNYGCSFKGTDPRLKQHETQSIHQHLILVLLKNKALEEKVTELDNEITKKQTLLQRLSNKIQKMEMELSSQTQSVNRSDIDIISLQNTLATHGELLHRVETEKLERHKLEDIFKQDILWIKYKTENLSGRVSNIESNQSDPCLYRGSSSLPGSVEHQVSQHDEMLSVHEVRLADMDLRFQVLETASYDGRLIWKIQQYERQKRDAISGKTLSLYSQPFYTSSFGYKMCARVYLNGDGMGKGTHMSVFFVVMRGEYDSLLPWPFRQKVTFMLLDQGMGKGHVSDTFKPDPNSSSFSRPQGEMNVASGCPLFVAQPVLENKQHQYIKDNTIFIKITVDVSDSPEL
ncbi:TNF receptor-associated factor 3-like [Leucoraja erinacea]|uniref:TNF receptor-associated factor 3-like n=1 Tax=Leucoraja erinaceus TaxID=7782 RepID=UPI002453EEC6|nr:TNF receptor-associated factor 3-like [Leucoraja erinacea]